MAIRRTGGKATALPVIARASPLTALVTSPRLVSGPLRSGVPLYSL